MQAISRRSGAGSGDAALRAKRAGFDIVYVYAGHDYLPFQFLSRRTNHRGDAYGAAWKTECGFCAR